jgi:hypothetical protein
MSFLKRDEILEIYFFMCSMQFLLLSPFTFLILFLAPILPAYLLTLFGLERMREKELIFHGLDLKM